MTLLETVAKLQKRQYAMTPITADRTAGAALAGLASGNPDGNYRRSNPSKTNNASLMAGIVRGSPAMNDPVSIITLASSLSSAQAAGRHSWICADGTSVGAA